MLWRQLPLYKWGANQYNQNRTHRPVPYAAGLFDKMCIRDRECAIPNFVIHEHHTYALSPYNKELCIHDYQPVNGKFSVPDLPGLGNELSEVAFRNCDRVTIQ